jgi:hypothetical protein
VLSFVRGAVSPSQEGISGEARAAQEQPGHGGDQDDQREGNREEVEGHENPVVDRALADP